MGVKSRISLKRVTAIHLALFIVAGLLFNCSQNDEYIIQDSPSDQGIVTAEKKEVKTFEIIHLKVNGSISDNHYNAGFGDMPVELLKTSDSTLTFYIPDVSAGEHLLKFELGQVNFKVTKSPEVNATQVVETLFKNFDVQVTALDPATTEEIAEVNSMNQYKQEVLALFNSLPDEQKRQTALFYEANKRVFKSFSDNVYNNFDASMTFGKQSGCPRTDFRTFYGCTAENLGNTAIDLKNSSKEFLQMLALAGASAYLAPASFGLSAAGATLALGMAGYLLITEIKPAFITFKRSLYPFLEANWIFSKALFLTIKEEFSSDVSADLQLDARFRSVNENDTDINQGTNYFISAMASLNEYWNKLTAVFGDSPAYKKNEESVGLSTDNISISDISNANVQLVGHSGEEVTFKSISGNEESFNYHIRVEKEGFVEEKTVVAILTASDSTEIYRASAIGNYRVNNYVGNGPSSELYCELKSDGGVVYTIYNDPSWSDGTKFYANWGIAKQNGRYYYSESGFWHFGFPNIEVDHPLTYPVTSFKFHNATTYSK